MAGIGMMLANEDEPVVIDVPDWSVLAIRELP